MRFLLLRTLLVAFALLPATSLAAVQGDVSGTPYEAAVATLQSRDIIRGYSDGAFRPHEALNRAEALKIVVGSRADLTERVTWHSEHLPPIPLFSDVDQTQWYAPYLEVAFEEGIVTGYGDLTFRPSRALTAEEAVTLLLRAHDITAEGDTALLSTGIENRPGQWFTAHVNAAVERNLIMEHAGLRLGAPITRGQFADIVYRLLEVKEKKLATFGGPEPLALLPVASTVKKTPSPPVKETTGTHPYASEKHFAITMPSLGVTDLTVTHPEDPFSKDGVLAVLTFGVGHLFGYPGGGGKIMIYGHSSAYPWDVSSYTKVFRRINELGVGDRVYVTYRGTLYIYEVSHKQSVPAADTPEIFRDEGRGEELILYTCWPPDSIAQRYLVHALPVETVALE